MLLATLVGGCGNVTDAKPAADAPAGMAQPASCVALGSAASDQNVNLYVDGDPTKPYTAHCGGDLKTYLPLAGTNMSSYPVGGCSTLSANASAGVITTWQMVHIDPVMHAIDTADYTYATSTGGTHESSGDGSIVHDYMVMPFASGRTCDMTAAQTVAQVDLTGTHFAISSTQMWAADGFSAMTTPTIDPQRTTATIAAIGFPVGASPCAPTSDYYTTNGGTCLQLDYVP
jgi:hypothetical protein